MRARLALSASNQTCELREVVLRAKPTELLSASPKGTVPVLVLPDGRVIEQSLEIMQWALSHHDPEHWLTPSAENDAAMRDLINECDGPFKIHLDRYKYPDRYENVEAIEHRTEASRYLLTLDARLRDNAYLFGTHFCLADAAIAPFVRQFSLVDPAWFHNQPWTALLRWLDAFLSNPHLTRVMEKYAPWGSGTTGVRFPPDM